VEAQVAARDAGERLDRAVEALVMLQEADAEKTELVLFEAQLMPSVGAAEAAAPDEGLVVLEQPDPSRVQRQAARHLLAFPLGVDVGLSWRCDQSAPQRPGHPSAPASCI